MSETTTFKMGFPADIAEDDARAAAVTAAVEAAEARPCHACGVPPDPRARFGYRVIGGPVSVDVIRSPEHEEAGEYLVRVQLRREPLTELADG